MTRPPSRRASDFPSIPYPVLIADIGGTNVRFAILSQPYSPLREFPTVQTTAFEDFASAASATVLDATAIMPRSLLIAFAGPISPSRVKLTNAHWVLEPDALKEDLNLETVVMFNDFEALALSLPSLDEHQLVPIGEGSNTARAPRLVVGPGTGLGVAALLYADQRYTPLAGEGGHISFGPSTERDFQIWPNIERMHGRVSAEALLSGNGLVRLYKAVARTEGKDDTVCRFGADVTARLDMGDEVAEEAVNLFQAYLGRVAGDLALVFLAKGGVYLAGGIAPRLAERFPTGPFRENFEAKAPHHEILSAIPTFLITEPKPAVWGLAALAQMPERFALDMTNRFVGS